MVGSWRAFVSFVGLVARDYRGLVGGNKEIWMLGTVVNGLCFWDQSDLNEWK